MFLIMVTNIYHSNNYGWQRKPVHDGDPIFKSNLTEDENECGEFPKIVTWYGRGWE